MKHDREEALTLEILQAIEARSDMTQRHLAARMGVALGLTNSYLRRCVRKELVKIKQAPANRYLYYLTPKGFTEKARLTTQYLAYSFDFYRNASASVADCLLRCREQNYHTIVFAGVSELTEIGSVRTHDFGIRIVGTFDPGATVKNFIGFPVWRELAEVPVCDAAVFSSLVPAPEIVESLRERFGSDGLIVPSIVESLVFPATEVAVN
jgi:DNA-binding MarR family transcriptional regulator